MNTLINLEEDIIVKDLTIEETFELGTEIANLEQEEKQLFKENDNIDNLTCTLESTVANEDVINSNEQVKEIYRLALTSTIESVGANPRFATELNLEAFSKIGDFLKLIYNTIRVYISKVTKIAKKLWLKMLSWIYVEDKRKDEVYNSLAVIDIPSIPDEEVEGIITNVSSFVSTQSSRELFISNMITEVQLSIDKNAGLQDELVKIAVDVSLSDEERIIRITTATSEVLKRSSKIKEVIRRSTMWDNELSPTIAGVLKNEDSLVDVVSFSGNTITFLVLRNTIIKDGNEGDVDKYPFVDTVVMTLSNSSKEDVTTTIEKAGLFEYRNDVLVRLKALPTANEFKKYINGQFKELERISDKTDRLFKGDTISSKRERIENVRKILKTVTKTTYDGCKDKLNGYRYTIKLAKLLLKETDIYAKH